MHLCQSQAMSKLAWSASTIRKLAAVSSSPYLFMNWFTDLPTTYKENVVSHVKTYNNEGNGTKPEGREAIYLYL